MSYLSNLKTAPLGGVAVPAHDQYLRLKGNLLWLLHSTRLEQQKIDAQGISRQAYAAQKMRDLQSKTTKDGMQNELQQASLG